MMKLAALFTDHAVLQREISVPVWGWMNPRSRVSVRLGDYVAQGLSGADGKFLLRLPPMPAGGPYKLTATDLSSGQCAIAQDVWVGEVWLASGQSNMEWQVSKLGQAGDDLLAQPQPNGLRMITIPRLALAGRQSEVEAQWDSADSDSLADFSAVGYYFARQLHERLGVAVGIINSSWGGTLIEAWTSRETLVRNPDVAPWLLRTEATVNNPDFWTALAELDLYDPAVRKSDGLALVYTADPGNQGLENGWADAGYNDGQWPTMTLPGSWTSRGQKTNGVFWFRREVDIPAAWAGRDLQLGIGAVDKQDITYFNGEQVGATGQGFDDSFWSIPRQYVVPGRLVKAGRNLIAVRAFSFVYDGGLIGPGNKMRLNPVDAAEEAIPLTGDWRYQIEHDFGQVAPPSQKICAGPGSANTPGILFDNMIAPLLPYALRGAIWYQGESNADNAAQYCRMMKEMIRDWRFAWGQGDFPFLQVQLANFHNSEIYEENSTWARLREAQLQALSESNTGLAVAIDIGEEVDIHPKNKFDVGLRLAQWALAKTYGQPVMPSGPLYSEMTIEGSQLRLRFEHVGGGLQARNGALRTFQVAGLDREFKPAQAVIDGGTVVVSHPEIPAPVAVRYAWADNPDGCNLYNLEGFPASPFRTDTW
jgi:sialate O-acetylesterase